MEPQYLYRWINNHGLVRLFKKGPFGNDNLFARLNGSMEGIEDPYTLIEQMRGQGGLHRTLPVWTTFDHNMVRELLRHNQFGVGVPTALVPKPILRALGCGRVPPNPADPPSMVVVDDPEHARLRKPVTAAFTPAAVARLRDRIVTVTDELIEALPDDGPTDLVTRFAAQVPIAIISEMLGFPDSDREMFLRWGDDIGPLFDLGISLSAHQQAMEASERLHRYLLEHIERLRVEPGEDILSNLVTAGELNIDELCASASLLMGAGFETTLNLIGKGIVWLLNHPDQLERLHAEPELWPNAVEEILRIDPPVQTTARTARAPLEVGGLRLREKSTVVLSLAGANRDPAMFPDPARFDVARANAKNHLAFGSGIHACLGASLARMEAVHALRALFEAFPDLRLTDPPTRRALFTLHGYRYLPAHTGPRVRGYQPVD